MLPLYTATIFLSAALLFAVQPMFARMVVPLLGGAPAVWNTQVLFCQALLLAAYVYVHASARRLEQKWQMVLHLLVVLLPAAILPLAVGPGETPPSGADPVGWLLLLLLGTLGLPFFALAATSPQLQNWFARSRHTRAGDPYFLYAASNAGSMAGLLAYPLLGEPWLELRDQSRLWSFLYLLFCGLILGCAVAALKKQSGPPGEDPGPLLGPVAARERMRWILLALAPSSLLLSVTTYLSTNIAAVPLLWVIPLFLYLLSFVLVFARRRFVPQPALERAFPLAVLPLLILIVVGSTRPIWLLIPLHLAAFLLMALLCHGALARERPAAGKLTEFYFWVALGGVAGGAFNVVAAPLLFSTLMEYPIALVLVALLWAQGAETGRIDLAFAAGLAAAAAALISALSHRPGWAVPSVALPALVCFTFSGRRGRFALGVGALLAGSLFYSGDQAEVIYRERDFYGIHRVHLDREKSLHILSHSGTVHGKQSLRPELRRRPLAYYHPQGPLGQLFDRMPRPTRLRVAAVGLGAGSIACYREAGEPWTFFEIDPAVVRIAGDTRFFHFLEDCGPDVKVVLGDARLSLSRRNERYDWLILDAYSSDAIPVHLLTREAVALYLDRLRAHGLIILHTSNRYLDLRPVVAALASDAGLVGWVRDDGDVPRRLRAEGKEPSQWMVLARAESDFYPLASDPRWRRLPGSDLRVWTDSYSSILSVLKWR